MLRSLVLLPLFCAWSQPASINVRRYVVSESDGFDTEFDNGYVNETVAMFANETALVLVDVWNDVNGSAYDEMLAENEEKRMLPLVVAARKLGMLIVHAPSEGKEWSSIRVLPGEILVTGTNGSATSPSRCDTPIKFSTRTIKTVLMTGYDTNKCVVDKPCGVVALSTELSGIAEVILLRDVTRGQYTWLNNQWYGQIAATNMLEMGSWLNQSKGVRSALLTDVLQGFGLNNEAAQLLTLQFPIPSATQTFPLTTTIAPTKTGANFALVVVSCSSDYRNDGFAARVSENRQLHLEPLLAKFRSISSAIVIHIPNGHVLNGDCIPVGDEFVAQTTAAFDEYLVNKSISTLFYVGYAANTDLMFGVGGMQRYYSNSRYLGMPAPQYYWVEDCTIAVENSDTLEGSWAKKFALAYRQPLLTSAGNIAMASDVALQICLLAPKTGPVLYELNGTHRFSSPDDVITDYNIDGSCGPSLIDHSGNATITISMSLSTTDTTLTERKALSFLKSVGTPFAVYQLRLGDTTTGDLEYQTANTSGWSTLTVPRFFLTANTTYRLTVVHAGATVRIYRNGSLVGSSSSMNPLDFDEAVALRIGSRHIGPEDWSGEIGDLLIRNGSFVPSGGDGSGLPTAEVAALRDIYTKCGGAIWKYALGTDAVGGGAPWSFDSDPDPCGEGWFGIKCNDAATNVIQFFPNTRNSGNPLDGCELPASIGDLTRLEHAYFSNDVSPSHLLGGIPDTMGNLSELKCMYFSHTGVQGEIPKSLERLTNLQVFLMRCNNLTGPLIDFSKLPHLKNVWFDTQNLTGDLSTLGSLTNLTYLQASHNPGLTGGMPSSLCAIDCNAAGDTGIICSSDLPQGCCKINTCGKAPKATPPPPASMGECFPQ